MNIGKLRAKAANFRDGKYQPEGCGASLTGQPTAGLPEPGSRAGSATSSGHQDHPGLFSPMPAFVRLLVESLYQFRKMNGR